MAKKRLFGKILLWEAAGFGIIILFLWLDELFDIPHNFFGGAATPVNVEEAIYETIIILFLGIFVILNTLRLLRKSLDGFFPVCSYCKNLRIDGEWIPIEEHISTHSEAIFTHGLCPECKAKHYGDALSKNK